MGRVLGSSEGNEPCNHERLAARVKAWNDGEWVREAAMAYAKAAQEKQTAALNV